VRHHEWQGQSLGDFPNVARWFSLIGEREAVKRAIAIGDVRMAPKEAYKFLYGQTAATLAPREGQGRGE
jgi:hypothetical protein